MLPKRTQKAVSDAPEKDQKGRVQCSRKGQKAVSNAPEKGKKPCPMLPKRAKGRADAPSYAPWKGNLHLAQGNTLGFMSQQESRPERAKA